ncbi:MAG TPA: hypothetical protein VGI45_08360 [Terracidiphilus sp.]
MADDKDRIPWRLEYLLHPGDPTYKSNRPDVRDLEEDEQVERFKILLKIRDGYKWEWNAGAKYLFAELIRAYGLNSQWREILLEMAKPKPGRKPEVDTALNIAKLRQEGMTAKQISAQLKIEIAAVESYFKRRRKPSIEERARAAVDRAFGKSKRPR